MTTPRHTSGFTLLELLVVVLILSSLALATLTITRGADDQLRYDDTRTRLEAVRRAVLGPGAEGIGSIDELGGFVVDMGRLPATIEDLLTGVNDGEVADDFAARVPLFSQTLDCAGFDDDDATDDTAVEGIELFKGNRGGYLRTKVGADGYRDGWSNGLLDDDAELDLDFGWDVTSTSSATCTELPALTWAIESKGADGIAPTEPEVVAEDAYAGELDAAIDEFDWLVPLTGWSVSATNVSPDDFSPSSAFVRLCVLVYIEGEGAYEDTPRWRHVLSEPLDMSGLEGAAQVEFEFPVGVDGSMSVPSGEHAVVLLHSTTNDDDTEDLSSWSLYIENLDSVGVDTEPFVRRARFRAGLLPPSLHLALRAEHEG